MTTADIQAFLVSGRAGDSFPPVRGRGWVLRFFSDLTTESMGKRRLEDGGRKAEKRAHLREREIEWVLRQSGGSTESRGQARARGTARWGNTLIKGKNQNDSVEFQKGRAERG